MDRYGWKTVKINKVSEDYEFELIDDNGVFLKLESRSYEIDNILSTKDLLPSPYRITLWDGFKIYCHDYQINY